MSVLVTVPIGKVIKPHGLGGEIRTIIHSDSPLVFADLPRIYLVKKDKKPRPFNVEGVRVHQKFLLFKLKGIDGCDHAKTWSGAEIRARKTDCPQLESGEFFISELVGIEVFLPDGSRLGVIESVLQPAGQEVWQIITSDKREVLFPVHEDFTSPVDLSRKRVEISPPDGLLDIYLN